MKKYKCSECEEWHEEWPALGFRLPDAFFSVPEAERPQRIKYNSDICLIEYPEQTGRFIRTTFDQVITNDHRTLNYGIWVSLGETSLADYTKHYDAVNHEAEYFGYLGNAIPGYASTLNIPMRVVVQANGQRPLVYPQKDHQHMFVHDFYAGISLLEAEQRVAGMRR
jgi:hypothetical protein